MNWGTSAQRKVPFQIQQSDPEAVPKRTQQLERRRRARRPRRAQRLDAQKYKVAGAGELDRDKRGGPCAEHGGETERCRYGIAEIAERDPADRRESRLASPSERARHEVDHAGARRESQNDARENERRESG